MCHYAKHMLALHKRKTLEASPPFLARLRGSSIAHICICFESL